MRVRRVKAASGATAAQIVSYRHGQRWIVEHLGSAHDPPALAALEAAARQKIEGDQLALDLELPQAPGSEPAGGTSRSALVLKGTRSRLLWEVLQSAYARIFNDADADDVFTALVRDRVIKSTSKKDAVPAIGNHGCAPAPSYATIKRQLGQVLAEDWQDRLCSAAYRYAAGGRSGLGSALRRAHPYFEADEEDETHKVTPDTSRPTKNGR